MARQEVRVARMNEIADGERKLVEHEGQTIGVFHHKGKWYAYRNQCLHRGGPVATGTLDDDILTCPWHGFQYNITTGQMLVDPSARLDTYEVVVKDEEIFLMMPDGD